MPAPRRRTRREPPDETARAASGVQHLGRPAGVVPARQLPPDVGVQSPEIPHPVLDPREFQIFIVFHERTDDA
ncbi:MAG: hypothetical protein A3G75_05100 [Verrucomicrobia bacterium RIFCSPLOWO2_12_FULL_64_8]|nr:MAG: hypothetical protein A3G75_05100 [Verrucomicrobia bacterium RIFCSPLOWO2_12_FULL_64_8]